MEWYSDITVNDRFEKLENKLTEIRKLSLGTLLLAREIWKDTLIHEQETSEMIKAVKEAEEAFVDNSLTNRLEKFENSLNVIHKRMTGIFLLLEDIRKNQQK